MENVLPVSFSPSSKISYVLDELANTELVYTTELEEICKYYVDALKCCSVKQKLSASFQCLLPVLESWTLLKTFHNQNFLPSILESCQKSPAHVSQCFLTYRSEMNKLYMDYCIQKSIHDRNRGYNDDDSFLKVTRKQKLHNSDFGKTSNFDHFRNVRKMQDTNCRLELIY